MRYQIRILIVCRIFVTHQFNDKSYNAIQLISEYLEVNKHFIVLSRYQHNLQKINNNKLEHQGMFSNINTENNNH